MAIIKLNNDNTIMDTTEWEQIEPFDYDENSAKLESGTFLSSTGYLITLNCRSVSWAWYAPNGDYQTGIKTFSQAKYQAREHYLNKMIYEEQEIPV